MIGRLRRSWRRANTVLEQTVNPRAELERLRAATADCSKPYCMVHWQEWRDLSYVLAILGEPAPTVQRKR